MDSGKMKITEKAVLGLGSFGKGGALSNWFKANEDKKKEIGVCYTNQGGYLQLGASPQS